MIHVVDYGTSNIRSVFNAFERLLCPVQLTSDPAKVGSAAGLVLPGVGSFGRSAQVLVETGLMDAVREAVKNGVPLLGICLGMQLLFAESEEGPATLPGMGLFPGRLRRFPPERKVPHMGWNTVEFDEPQGLFAGIRPGSHFYFVHSYYLPLSDCPPGSAQTTYGRTFASAVQVGRIMGTQFHPEKSGDVGLRVLSNFAHEICKIPRSIDKEDI